MFRHRIVSSAHTDIEAPERMGMAIIEWPDDNQDDNKEQCVICSRRAPIEEMTIGPCTSSSAQMLVCSEHLSRGDSSNYLRTWANLTDNKQINDSKKE